jgi:DNA polymerase-3 subunit alpha
VAVNGQAPAIAQLVREFPPRREGTDQGELVRGLAVRLMVKRPGAQCELQLDDRAQFFPTDAALASWMAQAHERQAEIVFD